MILGLGTLQLYFCSICAFSAFVFVLSSIHFWILSYPVTLIIPAKDCSHNTHNHGISPSHRTHITTGIIFLHLYNISHQSFDTLRNKFRPIEEECGYRVIFIAGRSKVQGIVRTQALQHEDVLELPDVMHNTVSAKIIIPEVKKYARAAYGTQTMDMAVAVNMDTFESYKNVWKNAVLFVLNPKKGSSSAKHSLDRFGWCLGNASQVHEDPYNERDLLAFDQHNRPAYTSDLITTADKKETEHLRYLLLEPQDHIINKQEHRHVVGEPAFCVQLQKTPPYLFIFTHSSPANFRLRQKIRDTWYSQESRRRNRIVNLFFLGKPSGDNSLTIQKEIVAESNAHHDIIQLDFIDSYRNLTLKHTAALRYLVDNCQNVRYKFILKTDDDMVLDVDTLVYYMKRLTANRSEPPRHTIYCGHMMYRETISRKTGFKWYISPEEYPGRTYPPYCYGAAYLMTPDLVPALYNMSLYSRAFWVDDVYITGFVARNLRNVRHVQLPNQIPMSTKKATSLEILRKKRWMIHTINTPAAFDRIWPVFQTRWNVTVREKFKQENDIVDDTIFDIV